MARGRTKAFDPDSALERAAEVFWAKGYDGTSMDDLIAGTGVGRQSLYDTFGSKPELFREAIRAYGRKQLQLMVDVLDADEDPLDNVRKVLAMWRSEMPKESFTGCLIGNSIGATDPADHELQDLHIRQLQRVEDAFARAFERAQRLGSLPDGRDPRALARTFLTLGQGLSLLAKAGYSRAAIADVVASVESLLENSREI